MRSLKTLLFLLVFLPLKELQSQPSGNCPLIPPSVQSTRFLQIARATNDMQRLNMTKNLLAAYCLNSAQVYDLATMFLNDQQRLDFAMDAWPRTIDPQNFYNVYDAFAFFSTVFRLHDFVCGYTSPPVIPVPQPAPAFPALNYPNPNQYTGPLGCSPVWSQAQFDEIAIHIQSQPNDVSKLAVATALTTSSCLTTAQVMRLSTLLGTDNHRLSFLKSVLPYVYDLGQFDASAQVLASQQAKNDLITYWNGFMSQFQANQQPPPCMVDAADYEQIRASIRKESFNSTRMNVAKMIIRAKMCFTAVQITGLVQLIDFESSRLELAKFAFDFCTDKENYFRVADALQYSSSKDNLIKFIQNR